ncbi:unnamed protein product [Bursaphelenchus xylophilus]|uniref:(pine wood nematode) hypothetical protein n=1 Tax=Bursaphelenchus xylophilus TaxID=6326 RepID=A0A1I7RR53_BURXY|nr:unnamed protein product [Bursaphelenchus xylophilus]CAG9130844.1 unnamed protein product [Bursaphelenchus xylophilus]
MSQICSLNGFRGADGSCSLSDGDQKTVLILQGPSAIGHDNEKTYRHIGHINLHSTTFQQDEPRIGDLLLLKLLENCIDRKLYPRTEILIHSDVQDIYNNGIDWRSFNGASLCLLDAAIRMNYFFAAVLVANIFDEDVRKIEVVVNPESRLLPKAKNMFLFVFKPSLIEPELIGESSFGDFSFDELEIALELGKKHSLKSLDYIRHEISLKLNKNL